MKNTNIYFFIVIITFVISGCNNPVKKSPDYPIKPVSFTNVGINDHFWKPRIDINRRVTIPFGFRMSEETGRIDNFEIAAGLKQGTFCSKFPFDDSDVYKIIEGASYALHQEYDEDLDRYLDSLIIKIGKAQTADGYLQTWRIIDPEKPGDDWWGEKERWTGIIHGHELYNAGHLYEAAVAHYQATGKKTLLDVAIKNANLVDSVFGPDKKFAVPGHEEIEIGLIKLYRLTGTKKFLNLAKFFIDHRGVSENRELFGEYHQDHLPVRDQREAVGHAVRAGYLYSSMADLAAITGDSSLYPALTSIWEDIVFSKMYITGGIGARRSGESFGDPYELPNATAYAETCATIAMVLWNHRMFLLTGNGKYYDVLERTLYNGLISGVSVSGDRFFYPNPLASDGETVFNYGSATRQPWFPCACCPSNISRILPSVPSYVYALRGDTLYVNLYISGYSEIKSGDVLFKVKQVTGYPWNGDVKLDITSGSKFDYYLALRIPGWAENYAIPGELYEFMEGSEEQVNITIGGIGKPVKPVDGYVYLKRKAGDSNEILLDLPMPVRKVRSNEKVIENHGKIALQRGPLVYCFEEADNGAGISDIQVDRNWEVSVMDVSNNLGDYKAIVVNSDTDTLKAIPYFLWSNRGAGEMAVWVDYGKEGK